MFLPEKKSKKWFLIYLVVFAVNMAALVLSRSVVGATADENAVMGFATFVGMFSFIACFGYFSYKVFTIIVLIADAIGIGYMYFVLLTDASPGFSDLTSILGYMAILGFGVVVAAIVQMALWLKGRKKKAA